MKPSNKIIDYFGNVIKDHQMTSAHISLYVSLFQMWSKSGYQTPFRICRKDVMLLSKIKSFATYHKCIGELHAAGFIIYSPSYNIYMGSSIEIIDLESEEFNKCKILTYRRSKSQEAVCFSVPMLNEVEMYFNEHGFQFEEAGEFFSLYQTKNWKLANNKPMKCWKSAARGWISKMKITNQNQNL